jgi:molybdopterin synthase catalytic subunit
MRVRVLLFAFLRESAGQGVLELEVPSGATVQDVWQALAASRPQLEAGRRSLTAALDRRVVAFDARVPPGAEIAFLPPVSGG